MRHEPRILIIGRQNSIHPVDIAVDPAEDSVSKRHAQLTIGPSGDLHLADLGSSNGTFLFTRGRWERFTQGPIYPSTKISFGDFETTGAELAREAAGVRMAPIYGGPPLPPPGPVVKEIPLTPLVPPPPTPQPNPQPQKPVELPGPVGVDTGASVYEMDPARGEKVRVKRGGSQSGGIRRNLSTGELEGE